MSNQVLLLLQVLLVTSAGFCEVLEFCFLVFHKSLPYKYHFRMIQVRGQHPTFGLGTFEEIGSRNPTVLSFVRRFGDDVVLCVNNLSRFPQPVELDLRRFEGYTPVELTGRVEFPQIGVLPYMLTLAGHGFYWFELAKPAGPAARSEER